MHQSGEKDRRGPLTKQGPKYLRWAMLEATMHALRHPAYRERYERNRRRLGKQRGAKVAQIDIARKLTEAIWHMLLPDLRRRGWRRSRMRSLRLGVRRGPGVVRPELRQGRGRLRPKM